MHLTFANIILHTYKYLNSEVAASRSEVMPCGIVKSSRYAYCVKLSVPHIVPKAHFTHEVHFTCANIILHTYKYFNSEVAASRSEVWAVAQVKYCTYGAM
jgi:hypothetical protein